MAKNLVKKNNYKLFLSMAFYSLVFLMLTFKGSSSLSYYGDTLSRRVGGPFESSNSTARYALTKAIVEDNTFFLSEKLARFSAPDVSEYNGKYLSTFTPGVSFVAVPFYILGLQFGVEQAASYLVNIIFGIACVILIFILGRKISGSSFAGAISGLAFLFGTNALSYSHSLTQHLMGTTMLLLSFLIVEKAKSKRNLLFAGVLYGIALLADIPNVFILFPPLFYIFAKNIDIKETKKLVKIRLDTKSFYLVLGAIPILLLFAFYNVFTAGSPLRIAQFVGRSDDFEFEETAEEGVLEEDEYFSLPFDSRVIANGLYILLVSNERGIFFYSPVLFVGLLGLYFAYKNKNTSGKTVLAVSTIGIAILIYSMFGDPWGGWSFGSRYMIPVQAIICVFISVALVKYSRNKFFSFLFAALLLYSLYVSLLGALTTSSVPPKVEAVNLPEFVPYTYEYNWQLLSAGRSSSYVYNSLLTNSISLKNYSFVLVAMEFLGFAALYYFLVRERDSNKRWK